MTDFEPMCAHSVEQRAAVIEQSMTRLSQRLERSTEPLSNAARSMVAFDSETLAIIEALHLPAAGTMVDQPKTLPSPAHFGRQLVQFRSGKVAALIHASRRRPSPASSCVERTQHTVGRLRLGQGDSFYCGVQRLLRKIL